MQKLTYTIVQDQELASYMEEVIKAGGIEVSVNESKPFYDAILGDIDGMLKYEILLGPNDFEDADLLLINALKKENADQGHLLNEVSNDALIEMVENPKKEGKLNSIIANIILEKRNIWIDKQDILEDQEPDENLIPKYESRSLPTWSKVLLVIASISGFTFIMLGLGGIIMGLFINRFKIHNAKGQLYFMFDQSTREFGLALSIISAIAFLAAWVLLSNPSLFF